MENEKHLLTLEDIGFHFYDSEDVLFGMQYKDIGLDDNADYAQIVKAVDICIKNRFGNNIKYECETSWEPEDYS